jgi:hypothetical protein
VRLEGLGQLKKIHLIGNMLLDLENSRQAWDNLLGVHIQYLFLGEEYEDTSEKHSL